MKLNIRSLLKHNCMEAYESIKGLSDVNSVEDYHTLSDFTRVHFTYAPDDFESWVEWFETEKEEYEAGHITDEQWAEALKYARAMYCALNNYGDPVEVVATATLQVLVGYDWVDLGYNSIGGFELYSYPDKDGWIHPIPVKEIVRDYRADMISTAIKGSQKSIEVILRKQAALSLALNQLVQKEE